MKIKLLSMIALIIGLPYSHSALAADHATGKPDEDRTFTFDSTGFYSGLDNDADVLIASGNGNISGNARNGNIPDGWNVTVANASAHDHDEDMFNVSRIGQNSGSFSISSEAWEQYSRIAIGLKVGGNKATDWAIYEVEKYAKEGIWSSGPKQGGSLAHYVVYTITPTAVPLPGAFWLLGSGLLGLVFSVKRSMALFELV